MKGHPLKTKTHFEHLFHNNPNNHEKSQKMTHSVEQKDKI